MKPAKPSIESLKPVTLLDGSVRSLTDRELDRLWSGFTQDENGCWIWNLRRYPTGYGRFFLGAQATYTHRIMHMIFTGPIAAGMHTDHLCRVRECCNPEHLEIVTPRENILRSPITQAAINASKTHCKRGHPLSGDNLHITEAGRQCRTCAVTAARERYAAEHGTPLNQDPVDLSTPPAPRRQRGAESCIKGHLLDAANTYTDPKGYRQCRRCRADAVSRYEKRKRERG
ncbi:HNH endonuclease signature motif containing protein [Streptomyces collinus]|uniref:HNH endonuclease signature motif containing protein n=1 Tax=Streptomyces collinus TaxID=42684 RepID=UPI00381B9B4D